MSEQITGGITLTIPSPGDRNWGDVAKTMLTAISTHDHTGNGLGKQLGPGSIAANAITGAEVRLDNEESVRAKTNVGAEQNLFKFNASNELEFEASVDVSSISQRLADITEASIAAAGRFIVWNGSNFVIQSASEARATLGLVIGTDIQAYSALLTQISSLGEVDSGFLVGTGTGGYVIETGSTARTSLGLGSLAILSSINNDNWSGTDLSISNGGTGASDIATARANLGLGSLAILSSINNDNWSGTDLSILNGGTGASDVGNARINLGAAASGANTDISSLGNVTFGSGFSASGGTFTFGNGFTVSGGTATFSTSPTFSVGFNLPSGQLMDLDTLNAVSWQWFEDPRSYLPPSLDPAAAFNAATMTAVIRTVNWLMAAWKDVAVTNMDGYPT